MKIAHRMTALTGDGSDGWDVFYRARALKNQGHPIIELTIGEHDIRTHMDILAAMGRSAREGHTGYAAVPGTEGLRAAVARRIEAQSGVSTTEENILITPGGQSALFAAHMAVLNPGDIALYCDPYYATYPGTLRSTGALDRTIPCDPAHDFQPRAADLESAARGARSLLVNSPNNPTGVVYDRATWEAIAKTSIAHDLWLISDEVYDTQVWQGEHVSPRSLQGMQARTLVIGSMSKSHAMTGSRIGWICGPIPVIKHLTNFSTHTTYGVPGFIQDAAEFALYQGQELEDEVAAPFRRRRRIALDLVAQQNLVRVVPCSGAMYLMMDMRATGLSGEAFAHALLDAHQIAVMPGESFGQAAAGHIRVAMTVADDQFSKALAVLLSFAAEFDENKRRF
ncbi:pyridoxal phosphate-dependent aminotransferase [Planktomarina sp.]|uniref:pyridoxal phosphate-dependent aminotransferase n=1 Tax=Planktomarina sp. TaxID=2024851 RepID=UPI00288F43A7|nr:pyridoxal phosphate-dependent aminotransferase [Planktomarina sp.]MDT2031770.1 pyridoxal phosphate-dependent aminotransferase [Planktomarina sp.]